MDKIHTLSKKAVFILISIALLALAIMIGPMDFFRHGYYCDEIDMDSVAQDLGKSESLTEGEVVVRFSPVKEYFAGFEVYMTGQGIDDPGIFAYSIEDNLGNVIENSAIKVSSIVDGAWYKIFSHANCIQGKEYLLRMHVENSDNVPVLATVTPEYLGGEVIEGNSAIIFAYKEPTFDIETKLLLIMSIFALWLFIAGRLVLGSEKRNVCNEACSFLFLMAILAWSYMYGSFDNNNKDFSNFQSDSEALVLGSILADKNDIKTEAHAGIRYGLSSYETSAGLYWGGEIIYLTDEDWYKGYSRTKPELLLASCKYTRNALKEAIEVQFSTGEVIAIKSYEDDGVYVRVRLDAPQALSPNRNGSLASMHFRRADGKLLDDGRASAYLSQFGLQGKVFCLISSILGGRGGFPFLRFLAALGTAGTFTLLVFLLRKKCGILFAGIFYAVSLLSPWIVNFARNLYWVEFTWFIPMVIGLLCSMRMDSRKMRVACYASSYIAIAVKCLCGYEYISSVMLGLIAFPLVDFVMAAMERDKDRAVRCFQMTFSLGVAALLGFFSAMCLHAVLRGDGNLAHGIMEIIREDVFKRTSGGNLNDFAYNETLVESLNASHWETLCKYFRFDTEVIVGIAGNLFPVLCFIPILLFVMDAKRGKLDKRLPVMYVIFLCVPVSWFLLAKGHSYIHTTMNYVLWYFGFVQICLYVIARWICRNLGKKKIRYY